MALIKCPECGKEVSDKAKTCPNCGCQLATTKWETIDLDETIYEIETLSIKNPSLDQIKVFAKLTGNNFVVSKDLIKKGHVFKNNSDTETIIHGYEKISRELQTDIELTQILNELESKITSK